jgi:hypothetical protein
MYRGGKICLTIHFKPLWAKNRCAPLCCCSACACFSAGTAFFVRACLHARARPKRARARRRAAEARPLGTPLPAASPHFGFAHALCLGLAPWLAAEVPYLVEAGERGAGGAVPLTPFPFSTRGCLLDGKVGSTPR